MFNNLLALCKQGPAISFLWLIVDISGLKIMKYFSLIHNRHTPDPGSYGLALLIIFHFSSYFTFWSSRFQIYLDNPEAFLGFLVQKDDLCFVQRSLNEFSVSPMYESVTPSSLSTTAWYTTHFCRHSFPTGHRFLFLQLHFLGSSISLAPLFRILALCAAIFVP